MAAIGVSHLNSPSVRQVTYPTSAMQDIIQELIEIYLRRAGVPDREIERALRRRGEIDQLCAWLTPLGGDSDEIEEWEWLHANG